MYIHPHPKIPGFFKEHDAGFSAQIHRDKNLVKKKQVTL